MYLEEHCDYKGQYVIMIQIHAYYSCCPHIYTADLEKKEATEMLSFTLHYEL